MIRKMMTLAAMAGALGMATAAAAAPIVYNGTQQVGTITATYSISTDGTLGDIDAYAHVNAYSVTLSDSISSETYSRVKATGGTGSLSGSFTASATGLTISVLDSLALYTNATPFGSYAGQLNFNYLTTYAQIADAAHAIPAIAFASKSNSSTAFATAAPVPEAATWATMIVGMGAIGVAMRRRRVRTTVRFA